MANSAAQSDGSDRIDLRSIDEATGGPDRGPSRNIEHSTESLIEGIEDLAAIANGIA
jgi:hypothetical protein